MSFTLKKRATFEASHQLPNHDGKCARLHGHSWRVEIEVAGDVLQNDGPKAGMLVDFADIARPLKQLVEESLDHWHLNESTGLPNPTSEVLAQWIFYKLRPQIPGLVAVTVDETCTSSCRYDHRRSV